MSETKVPTVETQAGILYHVTTIHSLDGIGRDGISPDSSTGKLKASWYISKVNLAWAILHVCNRHSCIPADVFVCRVLINWRDMRRTAKQHVYYTKSPYYPEDISPATWFIDEDVRS